jgi:hypothetical protein
MGTPVRLSYAVARVMDLCGLVPGTATESWPGETLLFGVTKGFGVWALTLRDRTLAPGRQLCCRRNPPFMTGRC